MRARALAALLAVVFFVLTFVGLSTPVIALDAVQVTITEAGRVTSYFDQYYVVNVDGNVSVSNPTDRDLFEVQIRFDLGSLSIISSDENDYISSTDLTIPRIPANSTVVTSYNIVGISLSEPALPDKGVLYTAMTQLEPVIYSDTFGQLQKANLEDESITGRPGRLVSVTLRNPTGFEFTVNSLRVLKTPTLDPNNILFEWKLVNSTDPLTISPDALFVRDILDRNSSEGIVYWLVADVFISRVEFIDASNVSRYTQLNLTIPPELLNYTFNETNESLRILKEDPGLYVRKFADRQIVTSSEPVKLSLIVNNYAADLITYSVADILPPGFTFIGGDGWIEKDGNLAYVGKISAKNANVLTYTAILNDTSSAGLDFFDAATIKYGSKTIYSDRVRFIRQYVPSQRIYVQKRLLFTGDDEVTVTITVQNLGSTSVNNLLVKDYLEDSDVFSQITEVPDEKGLWTIKSLAAGETWEVSYSTTRQTQLNILPNVYGVPSADVLRSLVLDNVIASAWQRVRTNLTEVIGITLLLGLPITYFVLKRRLQNRPPKGEGGESIGGASISEAASPSSGPPKVESK